MNDRHKNWLSEHFGRQVRFDEPMARHTWFRVGGPAEALVTPADTDTLSQLLTGCRAGGIPWLILGSGSNLLVKDGGIAGVVISLRRCLTKIESTAGSAGVRTTAQAGVKLPVLCRYCIEHGFAGLNFALGIPATVGGAIVMNAGTARGSIADVLQSLACLQPDGRRVRFDRRELDFAYRRLALKPGGAAEGSQDPVIVDGTFALKPADKKRLANEAGRILKERAAKQPIDQPSAGCFFKNPPAGRSAGELIEKAGLKGRQIGGARVSEKHANFIVNAGGASAADILALMDLVQGRVAAEFAVDLVPEVKIVGH
ncbi:MAG: UDP-N-acetylmuramate dehydrogenase [Desulfobacterales bacterium]